MPNPRFWNASDIDQFGRVLRLSFKCWEEPTTRAASTSTHWELRRIILALYAHRKDEKPSQIVTEEANAWIGALRDAGLDETVHFRLSKHSAICRGESLTDQNSEASVSTEALVVLLLLWHDRKRSHAQKAKVWTLLILLLEHAVTTEGLNHFGFEAVPDGLNAVCEHAPTMQCCPCARSFMAKVATPAGRPHEVFAQRLAAVYALRACSLLRGWWKLVLEALCEQINCGLERFTNADALKAENVLLVGPSGNKRRRADEDWIHAAAWGASEAGLAPTTGALGRAHGVASRSSACRWNEKELAAYHAAMLLSFVDCCHLGLAFDAGRFGSPAQENLLLSAWSCRSKVGCWLPQQVCR